MLIELDMPIARARREFAELETAFVGAIDPCISLLMSAHEDTEGHLGFAVRQMLVRATNDLVVAFHLLCHGYLNQAYNTMRIAYEGCDLLVLLAVDPSKAELWVTSERPQSDFGPGRVRDLLGNPKDEVYSEFCAMSHPRFAAARLTGYARAPIDDLQRTDLILRLGPFLIDDHPAIGHAAGFLGMTVGRVSVQCHQQVQLGATTVQDYEQALDRSVRALATYMNLVTEILISRGQPEAADMKNMFDDVVADMLREES